MLDQPINTVIPDHQDIIRIKHVGILRIFA